MIDEARERFAAELRRRRAEADVSLGVLAGSAHVNRGYLGHIERGERRPSRSVAEALDTALNADGELLAVWRAGERPRASTGDGSGGEWAELVARAQASDVSPVTLDLLDLAVDHLARTYRHTPPDDLLGQVRRRAGEVTRLLGGRATLTQRRRLLIAGGWLALLAATLHVDLGARLAARTARTVAGSLASEAEHDELAAWGVENDTWTALVQQDWRRAAALAEAGEGIAPSGGSAAVQLAAQRARAAARLGDGGTVRAALRRAAAALAGQPAGWLGDHHFVFDARKLDDYTATALAWLGDPAGEAHARELVEHHERDGGPLRRLATGRLDLGLILARDHRPDEAAHLGLLAVESDRLVTSNLWRAAELDDELAGYRDVPEVADLRQALDGHDRDRNGR